MKIITKFKIFENIKDPKNENFWKWFGDSKIVDESRNPLLVYHGTKSKFDIFKPSKKVGNQGEKDQIEGMYFTDNREGASFFSSNTDDSRYLKSVYLSIQNPYISESINSLKESLGVTNLGEVNETLKSKGYDGLIVIRGFYAYGGPHKKIIAFYPNQIKSATENNGDFSKLDNRITH